MKSHLQTYLVLHVLCSSLVPALAQLKGKAISRMQILMYNTETGVFELKDVHYPNEKKYDSAKVLASQLAPPEFFNGSILSMDGIKRRSGQILYKKDDRFYDSPLQKTKGF